MMKNWKKITVLVVILVVFIVAFIFLSKNQDKTAGDATASPTSSEPASVDVVKLVDIGWQNVTKMILKREDSEIVLTKEERDIETLEQDEEGNTRKITEKKKVWVNPSFDVDSDAVDDIAVSADVLETKRLIEENPQDLTIYGLDKADKITLTSSEGKEISVEIGNLTPTKDSYYAKKSGTTQVYTIGSYSGDQLKKGKFDIMSKNLYRSEAISLQDIKSLKFTRSGELIFNSKIGASMSQWLITEPLEREAELTEISKFLDWLHKFRVTEFVEENAQDLKSYGLDNPKYVLEYTFGNQAYTLKLGTLKDSKYYGMMNDSTTVFTVDSSTLNFIDLPLVDIISAFIYIPTIYDVEKLVVEMDGRTDVMLIDDSQDKDYESKFHFNGKLLETDDQVSLFRKYYQGAIGISGEKLDLTATPKGNWFARFTYTLKKAAPDKTVTVELIPTEDDFGYYLVKNGQYSGMIMGKRKLDDDDMGIRQAYQNLVEGLEKKE